MLDRVLSRKVLTLGFLAVASPFLFAQQTGVTNFATTGISADFASASVGYAARPQPAGDQRQEENAQGKELPAVIQAHLFNSRNVKKYCASHPDEDWRLRRADGHLVSTGHCPSDVERGFEAASIFRAHHRDFVAGENNAQQMMSYFEAHQLDPREERSYETAYRDLKKAGKLDLYAR